MNATAEAMMPIAVRTCHKETAEFEAVALPHLNDLYRTAARLLGNSSRASDMVQEAYLVAWRRFADFQPGTNCRAWLFQILFNVVRHERRGWFRWMTGKEDDVAVLARTEAPAPMPDRLTDETILAALDQLPTTFREVVLLVDVEEFSYKEASAILGVPVGTVMSRLSRARHLLREQLAGLAPGREAGRRPASIP